MVCDPHRWTSFGICLLYIASLSEVSVADAHQQSIFYVLQEKVPNEEFDALATFVTTVALAIRPSRSSSCPLSQKTTLEVWFPNLCADQERDPFVQMRDLRFATLYRWCERATANVRRRNATRVAEWERGACCMDFGTPE